VVGLIDQHAYSDYILQLRDRVFERTLSDEGETVYSWALEDDSTLVGRGKQWGDVNVDVTSEAAAVEATAVEAAAVEAAAVEATAVEATAVEAAAVEASSSGAAATPTPRLSRKVCRHAILQRFDMQC